MIYQTSAAFAMEQDERDPLRKFREQFFFPEINGKRALYFTGNSLGLQPKNARVLIEEELEDWARLGVEGHFYSRRPWFSYHEQLTKKAATLVGALPEEVVMMNQLTVNLHLLMVSFYRPEGKRHKILCEARAFPSDQYALESQIRFHGYDPDLSLVEVHSRPGHHTIHLEDIEEAIRSHGNELALVMIGGVNYITGQLFDIPRITAAAHQVGAIAGFDLAHTAGNVPLKLHKWGVDFACWCTYKYLNSGPGSVGGAYIHEKHHNRDLARFAGWWGYDKQTRFRMEPGFKAIPGAEGWQISNAPVFNMAAHLASLDLFDQAGMDRLREKSIALTGFAEFLIEDINDSLKKKGDSRLLEIITPKNPLERGAQLSIVAHGRGKDFFSKMLETGIIADWREPNVIRIAPVPLYNSFLDVYALYETMRNLLVS
jgi:kynureninase